MMTTCFSSEQLEGYLSGRLSDDLSEQIESHVVDCPTCEDTLTELDGASDTLIRTLRLKSGAAVDSPAWVEHMAERQFTDDDSGVPTGANEEPPSRLGDYELQRVIGRGGMSIVFAARHTHLGRDVALKVLLPTHQQQGMSRERFAREMRAVGALDHPAIVRATDAGQFRNTSYLVMEKIDGVDLTCVSRRLGPLSVADACQITAEAAQGLSYAHQKGVVHRDIKPSNLIIDDQGSVKILDFGLARIQSAVGEVSLHTTVGQLLGTLDYMAPEQADGSNVDARADIYALGATLFKLLAGTPPHGRSADVPILEHLHRLAANETPRLSDFRDDLPAPLVELVSSMLSKNQDARVSSAQAVAERLAEFTDGADLQALRDQACSPTDDEDDHPSAASIRASLDQIWPEEPDGERAGPPQKAMPSDAPKPQGRTFWSRVAIALLGLAATVCLGVVIILQTDRGEIRIESEVDNIHVGVVKDGRVVDTLAVVQGPNTIKVRSGKYEIRIDSPSDGVEVTPQQVIVKRSDTAIATIQRTPTATETVERAAQASKQLETLNLQIKLAETNSQLATAREKFGPDHPEVRSLVKQVARLQALTRPIPNEPVYEGRTLSDWLAQMRFEQQAEAKQYAAKSVVELSGTRPGNEGAKLALEAGGLLCWMYFEDPEDLPIWIDSSLYQILMGQSRPLGEVYRHTLDIPIERMVTLDRSEADRIVADMLAGDDSSKRDYALLLFAEMNKRLADGEDGWPVTFRAMNKLIRDGDHPTRMRTRTVLAACVKDAGEAAKYLTEADASEASYINLLCWFLVTQQRTLTVPLDLQIRWLGDLFIKIPDGDVSCLHAVLAEPTMGPLLGVNWDEVTDLQRSVVSKALGRLITELDEGSKQLDGKPQLESVVSAKSSTLCHVIDYVSPDESTREAALAVLNLRLEHLLNLRDRSEESIDESVMDSPSQVAVAITLLSGNTPAALKQTPIVTGLYLRSLELLSVQSAVPQSGSTDSNRRLHQLSTWYPYQVLRKLAEIKARSPSRSGYLSFVAKSRRTLIHPILAVDHVAATPVTDEQAVRTAAALAKVFAKPQDLAHHVKRHGEFAERIAAWAEESRDHEMIEAAVEVLRTSWTEKQYVDVMHDWLTGDDPEHMEYVVDRLQRSGIKSNFGEWRRDMAQAIAKVASKRGSFTIMDVQSLDKLGDDAEPAMDELAKFVKTNLQSPLPLADVSAAALGMLGRFPDKVRSMRPAIEAAIGKQAGNEDAVEALTRLLKAIE